MRLELDPQPGVGAEQHELLLDLGRVAVGGDLVGDDVLAGHRQVGARRRTRGPAPEMPCLASITTSAISPARASGASASSEAVG